MNEESKIRLEMIQDAIKYLESGKITEISDYFSIVEQIIKDSLNLHEQKIISMIVKYKNDQKILSETIEKKQEEITMLQKDYAKNAKEIVDEIKRL